MDVISVNLGNKAHDVTTMQQRRRLADLARGREALHIICTQEANRSPLLAPLGWRALPIVGGGAEQVRILVRKRTPLLGNGAIRMHPGREHQWPARWLPFVAIEHDGDPLLVIDVHLNPGIEAAGKWAAVGERARFTQHHIDSLADFTDYTRKMGWRVLVIGDTNVDAYADRREQDPRLLSVQLARVGLAEALPERRSGTHAGSARRIDRAFHSRSLTVSVHDLPRTAPYDHQPILARVR